MIDEGETLLDGLTREVEEETGLVVTEWAGPVYEVDARRPTWAGASGSRRTWPSPTRASSVDDPDGIVVDARFVAVERRCEAHRRPVPPVGARAAGRLAGGAVGSDDAAVRLPTSPAPIRPRVDVDP